MAASRAPNTSAISARLLARRGAVSKKTSVAGTDLSSSSRARRGPDLGGRKPAKRKVSVGSPELVKAAIAAEGPGMLVTVKSSSSASRTSL
jgi:hypothetical protein